MSASALAALPSTNNLVRNFNRKLIAIERELSIEISIDVLNNTALQSLRNIASGLEYVKDELNIEYWRTTTN